ncbi:permease, putative (plasmid) [Priestia megaterium]|nr:permease, putative [Priestia megaterium]
MFWGKKELSLLGLCFLAAWTRNRVYSASLNFLVKEQLGLAKENLQWLLTANGIGMILGGAVVMIFAQNSSSAKAAGIWNGW